MAVLNVRWESLDRLSPPDGVSTPGDAASPDAAPERPRADRPMMVWIEDPADAEENEKLAKIALDPDKVRVGAYFFRCVKMSKAAAAEDPLLADTGRKFPRIVFVSVDWKVDEVLEGKISTSKIFAAMKTVAKHAYEGNFEKNVKDVIKLLGELDKIADERKVLEEKEKKDPTPAEVKKIAKEREELDTREREALAQRDSLLKPELRSA